MLLLCLGKLEVHILKKHSGKLSNKGFALRVMMRVLMALRKGGWAVGGGAAFFASDAVRSKKMTPCLAAAAAVAFGLA